MPVYEIQTPDGRTFEVEGDSPPSAEELEQIYSSLAPVAPPPEQAQPSQDGWMPPVAQGMQRAMEGVVDWLPAIGGTAGAVLGSAAGPAGTIGGAALGAAGGEAFRQLGQAGTDQAPQTSMEAAKGIGSEAALSGILAAVPAAGQAAWRAGARVLRGPAGPAVREGFKEFGKDLPVIGAGVKGYQRYQRVLSRAEKAKLAHTLARGQKVAQEQAKVVKMTPKAAPSAPAKLPDVEKIQAEVKTMSDLGIKAADIAKSLKAKYGAGFEKATVGDFRKIVNEIQSATPKTATAPAKAQPMTVEAVRERVLELAGAPNAKYSRGQIAEILRSEFAPGAEGIGVGYFRKFADQVLGAP